MIKIIVYVLLIALKLILIDGRIITQCELARDLENNRVSRTFISNWICLVKYESGFDTSLITQYPATSSYGLFQISSRDGCGDGYRGKLCNVQCSELIDNIGESIKCAKKMFDEKGFKHWPKWVANCKSRSLQDLDSCFGRH